MFISLYKVHDMSFIHTSVLHPLPPLLTIHIRTHAYTSNFQHLVPIVFFYLLNQLENLSLHALEIVISVLCMYVALISQLVFSSLFALNVRLAEMVCVYNLYIPFKLEGFFAPVEQRDRDPC